MKLLLTSFMISDEQIIEENQYLQSPICACYENTLRKKTTAARIM